MTSKAEENMETAWFALHSKIQEEKIKKAFEIFRANEIEPILIKGWAAARFYPSKTDRIYADIDLCVAPESFPKAEALAESRDVQKLNVDLHCGLRHLDTVAWENLYENAKLVKMTDTDTNTKIRILRPEDHLRVLCVHWLTDGGEYKEKLLDIFYAVENRPDGFDWERCLEIVGEKRRRWIVCTIGLAKKYFGLSLKNTPIEKEAEDLPEWLISTVEREWKSNIRIKPLNTCLGDRKQFFEQILKRIPPNAIQATILMEGSFDRRTRIFYQFGNFFARIMPSFKRLKTALQKK
jgi:Uncharacterised nucleotidyltransferase